MNNFSNTGKTYTIVELNQAIKQALSFEFPGDIWVCGEIQDLRIPFGAKKHIYFNLAQKHHEKNEILAQIPAALFESIRFKVEAKLKENNISPSLKKDIEVRLLCKVDFYPKSGRLSLIVYDIDPAYTLGKIAQTRQKIIEELKRKGILEKNKQTPQPLVPLNIGLITSYNSAAYHDFISELKKSGFGFKVFLIDCHMQGRLAEKEIVKALKIFNSHDLDLIAITRGGGSTSDLSTFDSKPIAVEISESRFPVLSAIGHEINLSITELASNAHFKTPTKLAQHIAEKVRDYSDSLTSAIETISRKTEMFLSQNSKGLEMTAGRILNSVHSYFSKHREILTESKTLIISKSTQITKLRGDFLKEYQKKLAENIKSAISAQNRILTVIEDKTALLNPKNILKRGYSLTFKNKKVLKDASDLTKGDIIKTVLHKGEVISKVEEQ